jgi:hypothetical protein
MIEANPAKKVRLFVENNKRIRYLTEEEIHRLYQNASDHLKPIIMTALLTEMRRNEILKLKWEDIDFDHRIIFVRNTKNNEIREVPMNDTLMVVLKSFRFNSPYVFVRKDGKPHISIRTGFESALRRAGISDFRFHDLRHTFASHLIMRGVDLMTVKELLGYKTIDITLRYAHLSPDHKRHAVETLRFFDSHNLVTNEFGAEELEDVSLCKVRDAKVAEFGRRAGLRIQWIFREGSNPSFRTKDDFLLNRVAFRAKGVNHMIRPKSMDRNLIFLWLIFRKD